MGTLFSMVPLTSIFSAIPALICAYTISYYLRRSRKGHPLPPGPKGFPLVGNVFQMPLKEPWKVYRDWSEKQYGDMIYLEALGQPILVLNSLSVANDLLVKRAANYSDKMDSPVDQLTETSRWSIALMRYGNEWRDRRKVFHSRFNEREVITYNPVVEDEILKYLRRLRDSPEAFLADTRFMFGSILIRVAYGATDPSYIKSVIQNVELFLRDFLEYAAPGRLLVTTFPSLKNVPSWFPGTGWKQILQSLKESANAAIERPYEDAKRRAKGSKDHSPDVAATLISSFPPESDPSFARHNIIARDVTAVSYFGGSDTTVSAGQALFVALGQHPEVQRKAQTEIDAVTGGVRLPSCDDLERLPYVRAIVKELGRWHTVLPLGLPHSSTKDDVYNGYLIPANTWVLPNTWAMMHDPSNFDNPMQFQPERYLDKDGNLDPSVLDPESAFFGYGRRVCPGRFLAINALGCMVASLLAVYDIKPPKGKPLELRTDITRLLITPEPFECDISPRSARHIALLEGNDGI